MVMSQRRNMRAAKCEVCRTPVQAGEGYLFGPPWTVKCVPCSGVAQIAAPLTIRVNLVNGAAHLTPQARLGDRFGAYRTAISGARYMGGDTSAIALGLLGGVIEKLRAAEFALDIAPEVVDAIKNLTP